MSAPWKRRDPLGHLADALVEDILATPGAELLAESAEDYGDAGALSAEAEKVIQDLTEKLEARHGAAGSGGEAWLAGAHGSGAARREGWPQPIRTEPDVRSSGLGQLTGGSRAARSFEWLAELRSHLPLGGGGFARGLAIASVLLFVAVAGLAALHWVNGTSTSPLDQFTRALSPLTGPLPDRPPLPVPGSRLPATDSAGRGADDRIAAAAQYVVQLSWQRDQDDAVANLLSRPDLRAKFPQLLGGQSSTLHRSGGDGLLSLAGFTVEQARDFCELFKAAGRECSVREPSR